MGKGGKGYQVLQNKTYKKGLGLGARALHCAPGLGARTHFSARVKGREHASWIRNDREGLNMNERGMDGVDGCARLCLFVRATL